MRAGGDGRRPPKAAAAIRQQVASALPDPDWEADGDDEGLAGADHECHDDDDDESSQRSGIGSGGRNSAHARESISEVGSRHRARNWATTTADGRLDYPEGGTGRHPRLRAFYRKVSPKSTDLSHYVLH